MSFFILHFAQPTFGVVFSGGAVRAKRRARAKFGMDQDQEQTYEPFAIAHRRRTSSINAISVVSKVDVEALRVRVCLRHALSKLYAQLGAQPERDPEWESSVERQRRAKSCNSTALEAPRETDSLRTLRD